MSGIWTSSRGFWELGLRRSATARRPGENLRTKSVMNWRGRGATHEQERQVAWDLFMRVGKVSGR